MKFNRAIRNILTGICALSLFLAAGCERMPRKAERAEVENAEKTETENSAEAENTGKAENAAEAEFKSGVIFNFEATEADVSEEEIEAAVEMMNARLASCGYSEAIVTREQSAPEKITVKIPELTDEEETENLKMLLSLSAELSFRDESGNELLGDEDIQNAEAVFGAVSEGGSAEYYIELTLQDDSVSKWYDATAANIDKPIYIFLDYDEGLTLDEQAGNAISAPVVSVAIDSKSCIISGGFDEQTAKMFASQINSGKLPVGLTVVSIETVY